MSKVPLPVLDPWPLPQETFDRLNARMVDLSKRDRHGNTTAREGVDRCVCGCKYWESDQCIDCDTHISEIGES